MLSPLSDWCGVGIKGRKLFLCNYPYILLSRNASREIIYFHVSFFWIIFVNQLCSIIFYGKSLAHELWNSCQLCSIHLFARQFVCIELIPKVTVNGKLQLWWTDVLIELFYIKQKKWHFQVLFLWSNNLNVLTNIWDINACNL